MANAKPRQILRLESVDLTKNLGVLKHKPSKKVKYQIINVSISGMIRMWLENGFTHSKSGKNALNPGDTLIKTTFESDIDSPIFAENPFKIVEFIPEAGCDVPHNYRLEFVFEKLSIAHELTDMYNQKYLRFKSRAFSSDQFNRYHMVKTAKRLKDCQNLKIFKGKYNPVVVYDWELETANIQKTSSVPYTVKNSNPYRF